MCDALRKRDKISDVEFLEYFTESVVTEFRKNEKISMKQLIKLVMTVQAFLIWISEEKSPVSEDTLDKIRNFGNFYNEYLERTGINCDEEFRDNCLGDVLNTVNKLYPNSNTLESSTKYINQIAELESQISQLKRDLERTQKLYEVSQASAAQKAERIEVLNANILGLENDQRAKVKELKTIKTEIDSLNKQLADILDKLTTVQSEKDELEPFKNECAVLASEVKRLSKIVKEEANAKKEAAKAKVKETKIAALIYQKLLFEKMSVDDILRFVEEQGINCSKQEVVNALNKVRTTINLESSFAMKPKYYVMPASIIENGEFALDIPEGCKYYDIMLVSDFHLRNFDHHVMKGFDILNNYCAKQNINLILNLGDFFQGEDCKTVNYESAIKNYRLAENAISQIPRADGIYHAILGGNHDRNILKFGYDPLDVLTSQRDDIISLGYFHSKILLNTPDGPIGRFDLHHPYSYDFQIYLEEDGIDLTQMNSYLNNIYGADNRDNSYIDIFGHTHKNQFNYQGAYCYVPSYFEGKFSRGACHLRIYFDEAKQIKYMVFMPLSVGDELIKTNEIIYKKTLSK